MEDMSVEDMRMFVLENNTDFI